MPCVVSCLCAEYLKLVNLAHYFYLYLNLDGFRVSAEQQIYQHRIQMSLAHMPNASEHVHSQGSRIELDRENIREAAIVIFEQYLGDRVAFFFFPSLHFAVMHAEFFG